MVIRCISAIGGQETILVTTLAESFNSMIYHYIEAIEKIGMRLNSCCFNLFKVQKLYTEAVMDSKINDDCDEILIDRPFYD